MRDGKLFPSVLGYNDVEKALRSGTFCLLHKVAVKIVQPPAEKKLFLLLLRNESHCRFPTYLLLKLITLSMLVLSFRPKSSVVQVLLKEKKNTSNFSRVKIVQPT